MKSKIVPLLMAALGLIVFAAAVQAQNPPPGAPQPAPRMHRGRQIRQNVGTTVPFPGAIIADKHTKVYHLPGDKGQLPMEKNRVCFRTEAEAQAAGFHHMRAGHGKTVVRRSTPMRDPRTGRFVKPPR